MHNIGVSPSQTTDFDVKMKCQKRKWTFFQEVQSTRNSKSSDLFFYDKLMDGRHKLTDPCTCIYSFSRGLRKGGGIKRGTGTASAFCLLSCALKFSAELDFQTWLTLQLLKARVESGWHGGRSTGTVPVSQHSG